MVVTNMTIALLFSFIYIFGIIIVYYSKTRIQNAENKIYKVLLWSNLIGIVLHLACDIFSKYYFVVSTIISKVIFKLFLVYFIFGITMLFIYLLTISFKNYKKLNIFSFIFLAVSSLIIFALPISLYRDEPNMIFYTYGLSNNFVYLYSSILVGIMVLILIIKMKKISKKKCIPIFVYLIFGSVSMVIQMKYPYILIPTVAESFICCLMYFTIENPDVKMINELYKNKLLFEQTYEDKSNFLFEMTQEVREPLFQLSNVSKELLSTNDKELIKKGVNYINSSVNQLDFVVNDVLDISSLDLNKVKFINNKYNINNLFNDIVMRIKSVIRDNVNFGYSIDQNIPYLYGDSIKLKQIILSILLNSVKKTKEGNIEFNINTIERFGVLRLIITIRDSGGGITIEKINEVLSTTKEINGDDIKNLEKMDVNLQLCQKIIKLLGGNLMIKSEIGKGTEVILTIDQRTEINKEESILNSYEYFVNSVRSVLLLCQDKELTNKIKKSLSKNNITVSTCFYGQDLIDRIKSGKKYDFIIVQDDMKVMNGYTVLKELKKENSFSIPIIIMLNDNKINIKKHYIDDGFDDYILMNNFNDELNRIVDKY